MVHKTPPTGDVDPQEDVAMGTGGGSGPVGGGTLDERLAACTGISSLMSLAGALHEDNKRAIARIDAAAGTRVTYFAFSAPPRVDPAGDACSFSVEEERVVALAGDVVNAWRRAVPLVELFSLSGFSISYECKRYTDLVRLNEMELFSVAQRFASGHDDDSRKGRAHSRCILLRV